MSAHALNILSIQRTPTIFKFSNLQIVPHAFR